MEEKFNDPIFMEQFINEIRDLIRIEVKKYLRNNDYTQARTGVATSSGSSGSNISVRLAGDTTIIQARNQTGGGIAIDDRVTVLARKNLSESVIIDAITV